MYICTNIYTHGSEVGAHKHCHRSRESSCDLRGRRLSIMAVPSRRVRCFNGGTTRGRTIGVPYTTLGSKCVFEDPFAGMHTRTYICMYVSSDLMGVVQQGDVQSASPHCTRLESKCVFEDSFACMCVFLYVCMERMCI